MRTPENLSRRLFLQRAAVGTLLATGGSTLLSACASGGSDSGSSGGGGADKTAENPFGVKASDALDVVVFKGGYGDDYAKFHESLYKKKFAESDVKHAGITDITLAQEPNAHYVLVSTRDEHETEFRSFRIVDGEVSEEPVEVVDE